MLLKYYYQTVVYSFCFIIFFFYKIWYKEQTVDQHFGLFGTVGSMDHVASYSSACVFMANSELPWISLFHSLSLCLSKFAPSFQIRCILCIVYCPSLSTYRSWLIRDWTYRLLAIDITPPFPFFFFPSLKAVFWSQKNTKVPLKIITTSLLMMFSFVCIVCIARWSKISFVISLYCLSFSCSKNPSLNNYNKIKLSQFS